VCVGFGVVVGVVGGGGGGNVVEQHCEKLRSGRFERDIFSIQITVQNVCDFSRLTLVVWP